MNIFRYAGDFAHLASFLILFYKIFQTKQVGGISLKTQELYVLVFVTRYVDLLWNFASMYNWVMKVTSWHSAGHALTTSPSGPFHHELVWDRFHHAAGPHDRASCRGA